MRTKHGIPIQNIYYLLAYAWDHVPSVGVADLAASDCPDIHNLLGWILANGIEQLAQRGMDKGYEPLTELTPRLRGRMMLAESHRRFTQRSGRMYCEYDELTADTLPNRIIRTTCDWLQNGVELDPNVRKHVRHAKRLLSDITSVRLTRRDFWRVRLHRNNRHYRLLLHVCLLLFELCLPEEQDGKRRFRDLLDDERQMARLFEKFVRNFARRHCNGATVSSSEIHWKGQWGMEVASVLPRMLTDVCIEYARSKTILDCKFYRDALVTHHDRKKLHSGHLYQLTSYLQNKSREPGWEHVKGMLLYPAVSQPLDLTFVLLDHSISIHSVNLDCTWPEIHSRLLGILKYDEELPSELLDDNQING